MLLNQRLARLENGIDVQECRTCRGTGRAQVILVNEGEKPDLTDAACPDCGNRSPFLKVITLVVDEPTDVGKFDE